MTEKTSEELTKELQENLIRKYCFVCTNPNSACLSKGYICSNTKSFANNIISTVLIPAGLVFMNDEIGKLIPISEVK